MNGQILEDTMKSLATVKLSSVGGRKRQVAKEQKEYASTAIENWDNVDALETLRRGVIKNHKFEETACVVEHIADRIKELHLQAEYKDKNGRVITEGAWLRDLTNDIPGKNVSRVMKDKDGLLYVVDGTDNAEVYLYEIETEKQCEIMPAEQAQETAEDKVTEEGKETAEQPKKTPGRKSKHYVGERHPNGLWEWREYKPGIFSWRTIPEMRKKVGAKPGGPNGTPKHAVGDLHPNGKWVWKEYKPGRFDWRAIPKKKETETESK